MDNLESHYRINVAIAQSYQPNKDEVRYIYHFAVDVSKRDKAIEILTELNKFYPTPKYDIDVTFYNISGKVVHSKQFKKNIMDDINRLKD
jgi:hypothetical protein